MRRLKNWLRASMEQQRFTNLSILNIERDIVNKITSSEITYFVVITHSCYSCYTEMNKIVKIKYITLKKCKSFYKILF